MRIWLTVIGQWLNDARRSRAFLLADALQKLGHEVTLWTSAWDHINKVWRATGPQPEIVQGVRVIFLSGCGYRRNVGFKRYMDHWLVARDLATRARAELRPDVVVAVIPDHISAAAAVRFAADRKIPVIVDIQDKWPDLIFERVHTAWLRRFARAALALEIARTRMALRKADSVVAIMPAFLEWVRLTYGRVGSADRVFPLATERSRAFGQIPPIPQDSILQSLSCAAKVRIVFIGTFNRTQHPDDFLRAIDLLAKRGYDGCESVEFVIAGHGLGSDGVARSSAGRPNVKYVGWLTPLEIDALLARSHIGVVVTRFPTEVFNHKVFSYLSHGLAIASTATGDLARLIESARIGRNAVAGDPSSLADALQQLILSEGRLRAMRENAHRTFASRFDQHRIYQEFAEHVAAVACRERGTE